MKHCKWITVSGIVLVWCIKLFLRGHFAFTQPVKFLLGIAPNFLDGFLLPFAAIWMATKVPAFRMRFFYPFFFNHRLSCVMSFTLLLITEWVQLFSFAQHTFDYWDIVASATGSVFAYYLISSLQSKEAMSYDPQ